MQDLRSTLNTHFKSKVKEKEVEDAINTLSEKYKSDAYSFEIICINGGYSFMTKGAYHPLISQFLRLESKKKLSKAALETLAIISYKQPATKSNVESIRGVNCDYSIQKLLEKELIEMKGRAEGPGRPLLYGTTQKFMDHLGLSSLNELPKLKELEIDEDNSIGMEDGESSTDTNVEIDSDGKVTSKDNVVEQEASENVSEVIDLVADEEEAVEIDSSADEDNAEAEVAEDNTEDDLDNITVDDISKEAESMLGETEEETVVNEEESIEIEIINEELSEEVIAEENDTEDINTAETNTIEESIDETVAINTIEDDEDLAIESDQDNKPSEEE